MREIDPADPHPCDILRPCFVSDVQEHEFEYLVHYLQQSITGCGLGQAQIVANWFEHLFGHQAETLLRVAAAEVSLARSPIRHHPTGDPR